jgi:ABC-2 type transport system ATP-binding protein
VTSSGAAAGGWGAEAIRVRFGPTVALADVSLTAAPATVTAVVGGDGAGKTTLLRCLAGVLTPAAGTVRRPGPESIGYFPASTGTYPDLTVAENLAFRSTAYHLRGPQVAVRAAELTELAGLTAARDRPAGRLSGGMRHKLGVIAAMLHQPELLVLDEPSTGVDPVSRSGLWWLITRAAADGAAVVLATTYLDEAERAATVLVLDAGRTLAAGSPGDIVAAMPGTVLELSAEPAGPAARRAWRRNGRWRVWDPPSGPPAEPAAARSDGRFYSSGARKPGEPGAGGHRSSAKSEAQALPPDLQDAVTVAALARELSSSPSPSAAAPSATPPSDGGGDWPAGSAARADRAAGSDPLARCTDVTCRFGHFVAVDHVSLGVRPGEVVGLLGANGAGKTTLIRMLLGLQRASSGAVTLFGEPPSRGTRRRIGYVPQGLGLYDDLSAAENMAFAAAAYGAGPTAPPPDVAAAGPVPAGLLPLGLQRRLAFAQALAHGPDLLILDEPTSGVDPLGRARLWDTIARAAAGGAGVLVSTHYLEEAGECDRLIVLAAGAVVAAGTVAEIVGTARVTVVQTDDWAAAFSRLAAAGIPAALAGTTLRVRGPVAPIAAALRAGVPGSATLVQAPATLAEIFFSLAAEIGKERVPA